MRTQTAQHSTPEMQHKPPSVEHYRNMNHKTTPKAQSKNTPCLQKFPPHGSFSCECVCLQVSASHTAVLPLQSEATSEPMEMSDVVFTVLSAAPCSAERRGAAADTHQSTMHSPLKLPLSCSRRKSCMNAYEPTPKASGRTQTSGPLD